MIPMASSCPYLIVVSFSLSCLRAYKLQLGCRCSDFEEKMVNVFLAVLHYFASFFAPAIDKEHRSPDPMALAYCQWGGRPMAYHHP